MKKIALIGGNGFIGRWILQQFSTQYDFIIFKSNKDTKEFSLNNKKFKYRTPDGTQESWNDSLDDIDAVIHLAARRPDSKLEKSTYNKYIENIYLSSFIFEGCRINKIKNVVYTSSISTYGTNQYSPFKETLNTIPLNYYGLAKKAVDDLLIFYNAKFNLNIKSLRLAHVIGINERSNFMFETFVRNAIKKKRISIWGKGSGRREYIYVKDVTDAIMTALKHKNINGLFNIGTGINTSHKDLAIAINKVFDNNDNIEFLKDKIEDKSIDCLNVEKVKKELKWFAKYSLEEALYDMKEDYEKKGIAFL